MHKVQYERFTYCTVQHCTALHSTPLHCTVQYCTVQYSTVHTVHTVLYCTALREKSGTSRQKLCKIYGILRLDCRWTGPGILIAVAWQTRTGEIGRAHVWTPVTSAHLVCRLLLEKKKTKKKTTNKQKNNNYSAKPTSLRLHHLTSTKVDQANCY